MAANLAYFELRLSGGAANTSAAASIGGAMSTAGGGRVLSQAATGITTITGVTIDDAAGNTVGSGSLFFDQSAGTLRWTPPGGTSGTPVLVTTNGKYAIQGGNSGGLLLVDVVAASLPSSDQTNTIAITNQVNKIWDDVSKADSLAGDTEYRGLFLRNNHSADGMTTIKIWVSANTPGQDNIKIALATEAINTAIEVLANENTAPAGINFNTLNPVDLASGLAVPDLAFSAYKGLWVQRVVPAGVTAAVTENTFRLGCQIYV
jgi:hypothetical protein